MIRSCLLEEEGKIYYALPKETALTIAAGGRLVFDLRENGAQRAVAANECATAVPEPGSLALLIAGGVVLGIWLKRR